MRFGSAQIVKLASLNPLSTTCTKPNEQFFTKRIFLK